MPARTNLSPAARLTGLAVSIALYMTGFVITVPLFARRFEEMGAGVGALGASAMAYGLAGALAAPAMGLLADRRGRRPVVLVSLAASLLVWAGYVYAASAWALIALRGLAGLCAAGLVPAMTSLAGDWSPAERRAQWIAVVGGGASAGWIAGPLLGGWLYDWSGFAAACTVAVALGAVALVAAILALPGTGSVAPQGEHAASAWGQVWQALTSRPALLFVMLIPFGAMFAWAFVEPQFMFYAYGSLGWTSSQLGLVMSVYGVAFMAGEFGLGHSSDRLGRKPVLLFGLALFSAQFLGMLLLRSPVWMAASFFLAGLGNALYDPALSALILDQAPPGQSAGLLGIKGMAASLGSLLGPALVVFLANVAPPRTVFLAATGIVIVMVIATGAALRVQGSAASGQLTKTAPAR